MGPFMVEIVLCRVTRRGRKKRKGQNKGAITSGKNDGPLYRFVPSAEDMIKFTVDLSEDGPVFSALDQMMMKLMDQDANEREKNKNASDQAKQALKNLLRSGIPGIESMFAGVGMSKGSRRLRAGKLSGHQKSFHKMTEQSREKFMQAVFGKDGNKSIETRTAAALLAATFSGGDPQIGENIAQLLVPEMGDTVDQNMMAALMTCSSLLNAGASIEEVMKCMKEELGKSGIDEEEILTKTKALVKAFGKQGDEESDLLDLTLVSKQSNSALKKAEISPKEYTKIVLCQKILASIGVSPENLAKMMIVQSQLCKRGAKPNDIAEVLLSVSGGAKCKQHSDLRAAISENKLKKEDVLLTSRMVEALKNENEPSWKEVKSMKDILAGASTGSAEAIGLNLQRALKASGLNKSDIANVILAQKFMASLEPDPSLVAKLMLTQCSIAANGVPAVEIARVLGDSGKTQELFRKLADTALDALDTDFKQKDVSLFVKLYDQLGLKSNIPEDVIDHIDRNLIQVRCSLEDVAENHINMMKGRGEKESNIARSLCQVLMKTNASTEIIMSTMFGALKKNFADTLDNLEILKLITRSNIEAKEDYDVSDLLSGLRALEKETPDIYEEEAKQAMESMLKDLQWFPDEIRAKIEELYPPPPPSPKKEEEPDDVDVMTADEIFAKYCVSKGDDSVSTSRRTSNADTIQKQDENAAQMLLKVQEGLGSRRGSFLNPEVTRRPSIAIVDSSKEKKRKKRKKSHVKTKVAKKTEQFATEMSGEEEVMDFTMSSGEFSDELNFSDDSSDVTSMGSSDDVQYLYPEDMDRLKNVNVDDDLIDDCLEEGGYIGDDGILYSVNGVPVLDGRGSPIVLENMESKSIKEEDIVGKMLCLADKAAMKMEDFKQKQTLDLEKKFQYETRQRSLTSRPKNPIKSTTVKPLEGATAFKEGSAESDLLNRFAKSIQQLQNVDIDIHSNKDGMNMNMESEEIKADSLHLGSSTGISPTSIGILKENMRGAPPSELIRMAAQKGASERQLMDLAKEANIPDSMVKNIVMSSKKQKKVKSGHKNEVPSSHSFKDNLDSVACVIKAALDEGSDLSDAVKLAKSCGASDDQISCIINQQNHMEIGQGDFQNISSDPTLEPQQIKKLKNDLSGCSDNEIIQTALSEGASLADALNLVNQIGSQKSNGISTTDLSKLAESLKGKSVEEAVSTALQCGANLDQVQELAATVASNLEGKQTNNRKVNKSVHRLKGAVKKTNNINGDPNVPDEEIRNTSEFGDVDSGLNEKELHHLANKMKNSKPEDIVNKALSQGATIDQALALATVSKTGSGSTQNVLSKEKMVELEESLNLKSCDAKNTLMKALSEGASIEEAMELVRSSESHNKMSNNMELSDSNVYQGKSKSIEGVSGIKLKKLETGLKHSDPDEIVKVALSEGASLDQALDLVKNSKCGQAMKYNIRGGVDKDDLNILAQNLSGKKEEEIMKCALNSGASIEQAIQLVEELSGSNLKDRHDREDKFEVDTASSVINHALSEGASISEAIDLAKSLGASNNEIAKVLANSSKGQQTLQKNKLLNQSPNTERDEVAKTVIESALASGATLKESIAAAKEKGISDSKIKESLKLIEEETRAASGIDKSIVNRLIKMGKDEPVESVVKHALDAGATIEQACDIANKCGHGISQAEETLTPNEIKTLCEAHNVKSAEAAMQAALNGGATLQQAVMVAKHFQAQHENDVVCHSRGKNEMPRGLEDIDGKHNDAMLLSQLSELNQKETADLDKFLDVTYSGSPNDIIQQAMKKGANFDQAREIARIVSSEHVTDVPGREFKRGDSKLHSKQDASLRANKNKLLGIAQRALKEGATIEEAMNMAAANGASSKELLLIEQGLVEEMGKESTSPILSDMITGDEQQFNSDMRHHSLNPISSNAAKVLQKALNNKDNPKRQPYSLSDSSSEEIEKARHAASSEIAGNKGLSDIDLLSAKKAILKSSDIETGAAKALKDGATLKQVEKLLNELGIPKNEISELLEKTKEQCISDIASEMLGNDLIFTDSISSNNSQEVGYKRATTKDFESGMNSRGLPENGMTPGVLPLTDNLKLDLNHIDDKNLKRAIQAAMQSGASNNDLIAIAKVVGGQKHSSVNIDLSNIEDNRLKRTIQAGIENGDSIEDILQTAMESGASKNDLINIAKAVGNQSQRIANMNLNNIEDNRLKRTIQAAIQNGDSIDDILQTAKESGASKNDLINIAKAIGGQKHSNANIDLSNIEDNRLKRTIQAAMQNGDSVEDILKTAKEKGASKNDLINIATAVANQSQRNTNINLNNIEDNRLKRTIQAAVQNGDSIDDILQTAKESGASKNDLINIAKAIGGQKHSNANIDLSNIEDNRLKRTIQAAVQNGDSIDDILQTAKESGASKNDLINIAKAIGGQKHSNANIDLSNIEDNRLKRTIQAAIQNGESIDDILQTAKESGASKNDLINIAKGVGNQRQRNTNIDLSHIEDNRLKRTIEAAMQNGDSVEDILKIAKEKNASKNDLLNIAKAVGNQGQYSGNIDLSRIDDSSLRRKAQAAIQNGESIDDVLQTVKQSGASNEDLISITKAVSNERCSNADIDLSTIENRQLKKILQAAIQNGNSTEDLLQTAKESGASKNDLIAIAKVVGGQKHNNANIDLSQIDDRSLKRSLQAAIQNGDSIDDILQTAKESGASKNDLINIAKAAGNQRQRNTNVDLSTIEDNRLKRTIEAAMQNGDSVEDILKTAKEKGASKNDLINIAKTVGNQSQRNTNMNLNDIEDKRLKRTIQAALQNGESMENVLQTAKQRSASKNDLMTIAKAIGGQKHSNSNIDLSNIEDNRLKRTIQAAIENGDSIDDILQTAKESGASKNDLINITKALGIQRQYTKNIDLSQIDDRGLRRRVQAAIQNGDSIDDVLQNARQSGASNKDLMTIAKAVSNNGRCKNANIDLNTIENRQLKKTLQAAIQNGNSMEDLLQIAKDGGASENDLIDIAKIIGNQRESKTNIDLSHIEDRHLKRSLQAGIQNGDSLEDILQKAKEHGVSRSDLLSMIKVDDNLRQNSASLVHGFKYGEKQANDHSQKSLLSMQDNRQELSSEELLKIQKRSRGLSGTDTALSALKQGASLTQAVQLAVKNGASADEIELIKNQVGKDSHLNQRTQNTSNLLENDKAESRLVLSRDDRSPYSDKSGKLQDDGHEKLSPYTRRRQSKIRLTVEDKDTFLRKSDEYQANRNQPTSLFRSSHSGDDSKGPKIFSTNKESDTIKNQVTHGKNQNSNLARVLKNVRRNEEPYGSNDEQKYSRRSDIHDADTLERISNDRPSYITSSHEKYNRDGKNLYSEGKHSVNDIMDYGAGKEQAKRRLPYDNSQVNSKLDSNHRNYYNDGTTPSTSYDSTGKSWKNYYGSDRNADDRPSTIPHKSRKYAFMKEMQRESIESETLSQEGMERFDPYISPSPSMKSLLVNDNMQNPTAPMKFNHHDKQNSNQQTRPFTHTKDYGLDNSQTNLFNDQLSGKHIKQKHLEHEKHEKHDTDTLEFHRSTLLKPESSLEASNNDGNTQNRRLNIYNAGTQSKGNKLSERMSEPKYNRANNIRLHDFQTDDPKYGKTCNQDSYSQTQMPISNAVDAEDSGRKQIGTTRYSPSFNIKNETSYSKQNHGTLKNTGFPQSNQTFASSGKYSENKQGKRLKTNQKSENWQMPHKDSYHPSKTESQNTMNYHNNELLGPRDRRQGRNLLNTNQNENRLSLLGRKEMSYDGQIADKEGKLEFLNKSYGNRHTQGYHDPYEQRQAEKHNDSYLIPDKHTHYTQNDMKFNKRYEATEGGRQNLSRDGSRSPSTTNSREFKSRRSSRLNAMKNTAATQSAKVDVDVPRKTSSNKDYQVPDYTKMGSDVGGSGIDLGGIRFRTTARHKDNSFADSLNRDYGPNLRRYKLSSSTDIPNFASNMNGRESSEGRSRFDISTPLSTKLSTEELDQIMSVFKMEGILISRDGVNKYRTEGDSYTNENISDAAFVSALKELEARMQAGRVCDDSKEKLDMILQGKADTISSLRAKLEQKRLEAQNEIMESTRRIQNRKRTDLYTNPYLESLAQRKVSQISPYSSGVTRSPKTSFQDIPTDNIKFIKTASHLSHSFNNTSILKPSVRRRFLLMKQMEEDREQKRTSPGYSYSRVRTSSEGPSGSYDFGQLRYNRETRSMERSSGSGFKMPLMVYSGRGFTRCFRIAQFYDNN